MEETNTPMFKSVRPDEILSVQKDPVSGNTAPLGATPAEVRDDIPIMASPNEFMIDAATRRYYGTEFFENLQAAAKQGFQRIKAGEESFFRDDELEIEEEAQKMNEGGEVEDREEEVKELLESGTRGYGGIGPIFTGFEFKTYEHPSKPDIQIVFFNGRPLRPIPEGYVLKGELVVETDEEDTIGGDGEGVDVRDLGKTWRNKQAQAWTVQDFKQYAEDMSKLPSEQVGVPNPDENFVVNLLGNILGGEGSGFGKAANSIINRSYRQRANNINNEINKMLKSGLDADGNPLTDETNNILFQAQLAAQQTDANLGGTSMTGTAIYDQKFYQTETGDIDIDALMPPEIDKIPDPTAEEIAQGQEIMSQYEDDDDEEEDDTPEGPSFDDSALGK